MTATITEPPYDRTTPAAVPIEYRTIVADWELLDGVSVDLRPVVVTVPAATTDEAIEAASDRLQDHFGPNVPELGYEEIERDWWFGLNETDALLRVCAVIVGAPTLDNDDEMTNEIH
ncbi:hypothetical protein ACF08M_33335 [Streptomyces sp. NPDC015032]|uniref:hypothetical protein n=1 Tax=Streptomyces sp. NPDC015032 TaxID=3364937 RepID=UPI0036F7341F